VPGELLVRWKATVKPAARLEAAATLGASRLAAYDVPGLERLRVEGVSVEEAVARLAQDPRVEYAEPNLIWSITRTPDDPLYPEQYGLHNVGQTGGVPGADIGAEAAWERFTGDPDLLIGDLDTGAQLDHPDLAANLWTNPGEIPGNGVDDDGNGYVDDVHGYDFYNHDGDPSDDNGHGTHTAGTIAAVGDNGLGVAGVVWHARIVVLKFLNASGNGPTSAAVEALQYGMRVGVRLTNNSWGGGVYSRALEDAILAAGDAGQLFVAAAGNARSNTDVVPTYPGSLPADCILTVAATDARDQLASFSNFGARTVDLGAPGVDILSTTLGGDYRLLSGTSMATPHVTGAAAFLMGRFPGMTAADVKDRLLRFAEPLASLADRCVSGGRLNLALASADPDTLPPGDVTDLHVVAPGSNSMDLAWTATGDDGETGTATRYDLRVAVQPITPANFASATRFPSPRPSVAGSSETWRLRGLAQNSTYWCALMALDEFGNAGPVSNVISFTTLGPPTLALLPATVSAAANTGEVFERAVELVNDSPGTLEWTASAPEFVLGATPATAAFDPPWPAEPLVKGVDGAPRDAAVAGAGGPDAFGYRWSDSDEPQGPVFQWAEIATPANQVSLSGDEALSAALPVGFSFPLYGRRFTTLRVCTNGYLQFGAGSPAFVNTGLPSTGAPRNLVAPFWDDLQFGTGQHRAYLRSDGTRCVITWQAVPRYNDPASEMTFQCILYPTGEVRFQYQRMTGNTSNATLGLQDSSRTIGLTVAFNQPYVRDGLAVRIVPLRQWISSAPASGFVPSGARDTLHLRLDAAGLGSATYAGRVRIITNAPASEDTSVAVSLAVSGTPHAVLSPTSLDFDAHFVGFRDTLQLTFANDGVDPLHVTGLALDSPAFAVDPGGFELLPGESLTRPIEFSPVGVGEWRATLVVSSDDPTRPTLDVPLVGVGSETPQLETSTPAIAVAATNGLDSTAAARTQVLLLRNSGGAPLVWSATTFQGITGGAARARPAATEVVQAKGVLAPGPGTLGDGGPDAFGYRWVDSDALGGPAFAWQEVADVGERLFGGADDSTTTVALPFAFPFYGRSYTSVNVCTNGFLSFVSRDSSLVNQDLPSDAPGVPRALVAPLWTDLDLRPFRGPGRVVAHDDGSKFILEWKDATHFSGASPYTFQVFLWPSGVIEFQYLELGALTNAATIGIQDSTGTVGLPVVFNAPYVHAGLRVRFTFEEDWLKLDRLSGSTPPGGVDTLRVTFDARGRRDGDYSGEVRIASNDVEDPMRVVPCALHVGLLAAPAEAQPGAVVAVSRTPAVRLLLSPPDPGESLVTTSLRLGGEPIGPSGDPRREPDGRLSVAFRTVDLLGLAPTGLGPGVTWTGEYERSGWFAAGAPFELRVPSITGPALPAFGSAPAPAELQAGEPFTLAWSPPAGGADDYAVAWSADGGTRWSDLGYSTTPRFTLVPPDSSGAALVEIVARRGDAVLGTWLSAPLVVTPGPRAGTPTRLALLHLGPQPARGESVVELALPAASAVRVDVHDVRGARVRTLADGRFTAGRWPLRWDGLDAGGRRAPAGFYVVRATVGGRSTTLRLTLLR